ncbi:daunorubicin resistance protein DrrA family ABC transporter ATP-binding protein [Dictyobacter arantiisoli]|uniref:Daunorubicin resistance protein DrrA family ABC transporter ATP-binding protein n=1 Tax=Dictyobacter arantiisoli TaxID=2014874 RepID=A0A5A5TJN4_9CHLR|nr:daunorubicin resistance protein DrrA family ABC transporter ATP-binding protein [Dictyobacter arantiisoli]
MLGPNGSGKTTTMNMLSTLSLPTSGTVRVLGFDVQQQAREVKRLLGCVPQETALFDELTPWQTLLYHAALYGVPKHLRTQRIRAMLELVELWEQKDIRVKTFSGGMKRRLALARALLHHPRVLYLDEPTLGVDVQNRHSLYRFIRMLPQQGVTVLLTTNDLHEAELLCTRVAILDHGRVQVVDTPANLIHAQSPTQATQLTVTLDSPEKSEALVHALRQVGGLRTVDMQGASLSLLTDNGQDDLATILRLIGEQGRTVRAIQTQKADLEQVFLQVTGAVLRDEAPLK